MRPPLQVLLQVPDRPKEVAGLPVPVRTARLFSGPLQAGRLVLSTASHDFLDAWACRLAGLPWVEAVRGNGDRPHDLGGGTSSPYGSVGRPLPELLADGPALAISGAGLTDAAGLGAFLQEARARTRATVWASGGVPVAAYYPDARALSPAAPLQPASPASLIEAGPEDWLPLDSPALERRAEERVFAALPQACDGYLARLDRRISMALTRRLLAFPVTPNQITALSLFVGLFGAWWLASPDYPLQVLGAMLLWSSCVLDGCDGEVARLKLLASPAGARFDVIADNLVHLAVFVAIPVQVQRANPGADMLAPGALLVSGVLLSMLAVWRLILVRPEAQRGALARVYERVASRDFLYLVLALTIVRRLELFVWAAGVGAHLFWASLAALSLRERRRAAA